jgi:hypothetical protein
MPEVKPEERFAWATAPAWNKQDRMLATADILIATKLLVSIVWNSPKGSTDLKQEEV